MAEATRFLQSCKKDPGVQPYLQKITPQMFKEAFSSLSERNGVPHLVDTLDTTRLLYYYGSTLQDDDFFLYRFAPKRWNRVTDVMLEKDPETPRVHRLRVIQLMEPNLNQSLLLLFTRTMVQQAETHALLHKAQWYTRNQKLLTAPQHEKRMMPKGALIGYSQV